MPAFSRLQLAQALLEYDNENLPPEAPRRSAYDSAIFAHLRRARGPSRPANTVYEGEGARRSILSVRSPGDNALDGGETGIGTGLRGSVGARRSIDIQNAHPTRKSMDVLRSEWSDRRASKFEPSDLGYLETPEEEEEEEDGPEGGMDLSSWGLDKFVVKDQEKLRPKSRQSNLDKRASVMSRAPSDMLPNPFARTPTPSGIRDSGNVTPDPEIPVRSRRQSDFGAGNAFLDAHPSEENLAREPSTRRRSVANPLDLEEYRVNGPRLPLDKRRQSVGILPSESIPFPSNESSTKTADNDDIDLPNPFALPAPPPERISRFDPKARHSVSQLDLAEGDAETATVRTGMMREGAAHTRTYSNASIGTRAMLDDFRDDAASYMTGRPLDGPQKPISRMELLRPKVLVMPSPLQGSEPKPPTSAGRAGFMLSSDGAPLPPGATPGPRPGARPTTQVISGFTPNPRMSMSLSQLTFRNTLMVDGARDVAYNDIEEQLHRATSEGEQAHQVWDEVDDETEAPGPERPAGRLYGRSLMDDLQDRKAQIHGRQRVFRGDNRPAMMERGQIRREGPLIDSAALQARPDTVLLPHGPTTAGTEPRPNANRASTIQPLLNFDSNAEGRIANSKSVFGVDTVWEREMAKLKEMQEQQRQEDEAQRAREEEKQKRKGKKIKKGKGKNEPPVSPSTAENAVEPPGDPNRLSSVPPILPSITPLNQQLPPASPVESEASLPPAHRRHRSVATLDAGGWFAGSSDGEEDSGAKRDSRQRVAPVAAGRDEDSDDDVPLTSIKVRAPASDDDEDAPLSSLKPKPSVLPDLKPTSTLDIAASLGLAQEPAQTKGAGEDDSDDEVPLAVRRQSMMPQSPSKPVAGDDDDDDEKPLGLRMSQAPNAMQQRRQAEYQQMMLMQQQQQLMMQQAMFTGSMLSFQPQMGGPGSVHSFGAPMFGGSMPVQDPKLTRVDKWRRDVSGVESTDS